MPKNVFIQHFGDLPHGDYVVAQAPGRLELAGNHTDHQGGCVISAALNKHIKAVAATNGLEKIRVAAKGFGSFEIDVTVEDAFVPHADEKGTSAAIVRGMVSRCALAHTLDGAIKIPGFDLAIAGDLPSGAGVSSSAALEMLVGAVVRTLVSEEPHVGLTDEQRLDLALEGCSVEREFFGKQCGAQDQIASAFGAAVYMDFACERPKVARIPFTGVPGYQIFLINSGVDHSRYNNEFNQVSLDMFAIANALGAQRLGEVRAEVFAQAEDELSREFSQAQLDRARHFYGETARVHDQYDALCENDFEAFLQMARASGKSSELQLRNIVPANPDPDDVWAQIPQDILDACERMLCDGGAWRIHGGGFGGAVLAFVPQERVPLFTEGMAALLGKDACIPVGISDTGVSAQRVSEFEALERLYWSSSTDFGELEISVNLAKPEKDPKAIAQAAVSKNAESNKQCDLCRENDFFNESAELEMDARLGTSSDAVEFPLDGEPWRLHFSPYGYYAKHCVVMTIDHHPMAINQSCFERLIALVDKYPYYFMGSNADLPIVGGSILAHDHFQGGGHVFSLMKAPVETQVSLVGFPHVSAGIVKWPSSVLRLEVSDSEHCAELIEAATAVLDTWRVFSYAPCEIVAASNGEQHNTITPILYKRAFVDEESKSASAPESAVREFGYVLDLTLRNNRTSSQRPFGIFHPDESLHHIKKENIGLIEIMGLAILPPRVLESFPNLHERTPQGEQQRKEVAAGFVDVLNATGVFKRNETGAQGWQEFITMINRRTLSD